MPTKTVTLKQILDKLIEHDGQFKTINQKLAGHDRLFKVAANRSLDLEDSIKAQIARLDDRMSDLGKGFEKLTGDFEKLTTVSGSRPSSG